jgi:hypothetical protein
VIFFHRETPQRHMGAVLQLSGQLLFPGRIARRRSPNNLGKPAGLRGVGRVSDIRVTRDSVACGGVGKKQNARKARAAFP